MIRIGSGDCALFASDVHIGAHAPDTAEGFLRELESHATGATHLFLLGDLFEAWVGDDWADPMCADAIERIAALAARGVEVYVMRGNRDFLLDVALPSPCHCTGFSMRVGGRMIADPEIITLFGKRALLAHGDALCTDDEDYQRFRVLTRDPSWQRAFLSRPLDERVAIAGDLRARSELSKVAKAEEIMDVTPSSVSRAISDARADLMIHGHTHRPATHAVRVDGRTVQRWVLPDWDAATGRGGLLKATEAGLETIGGWGAPPPAFNPPSG